MRIYVTGADGMLGTALLDSLAEPPFSAKWTVKGVSATDFDIADAAALRASLDDFAPDVVLHAAACAIVDDCESDPQLARRVNVAGTHHVADACRAAGMRLIYISSDYVFDGRTPPAGGYREDCVPNPVSTYGLTKLAGESIAATVPDHLVVRTSWLFGGRDESTDIVLAAVRRMLRGESPELIHDQYSCPTYTADLAAVLLSVLADQRLNGVLHIANVGSASWHQVGVTAARELRRAGVARVPDPEPVMLARSRFAGQRPLDSSLCTARLASLGLSLPHWSAALGRLCARLLADGVAGVGPAGSRLSS
jgi:dTDP-4-dehydrorhamnose reductase